MAGPPSFGAGRSPRSVMKIHVLRADTRALVRAEHEALGGDGHGARLGQAKEVANVIYFPSGEESSYMTDAVVLVDGRATAKG